jgi:hypothetical protein
LVCTERFVHGWTVKTLTAAGLSDFGMGDDGGSGALLFGQHRALLGAAQQQVRFRPARRRMSARPVTRSVPSGRRPELAMFDTGQKLSACALSGSMVLVIVTGVQSWSHGGAGPLHGVDVLLSRLLLAAHVFMAVLIPSTRPALHGKGFGRVRRSWDAYQHRGWLDSLERQHPHQESH